MPATLVDKIWDAHRIASLPDGKDLIHIDRHVLHEVTRRSPSPSCAKPGERCATRS